MRRLPLLVALLLLSSTTLLAEAPLTVGFAYTGVGNSGDSNPGPIRTDIDLTNPATATGNVTAVHFRWSDGGCVNAVKIKFYRRSGNTLTMTAERGPFSTLGDNNVTLTPPVAVQQGDLIGLARVANCGNAEAFFGGAPSDGYVVFPSDLSGSADITAGTRVGVPLALSGSGTATEALRAIIPVVGSTAGSFGASFKTPLQFLVTSPSGFLGRLQFHPQGVSGSASDPYIGYSVGSGKVVDYADVVVALERTGLGSIDVITPADVPTPVFAVRVLNDAGALGTSGFIEDLVRVGAGSPRVLSIGATGYLITPSDLTRSRLNIGVRTLYSGAAITVTLRDSEGATIRTVSKSYLPNFFQQTDAATFTGGAIGAGQSIKISVTGGSIIVYGATTDNTTNDPAVQFAEGT